MKLAHIYDWPGLEDFTQRVLAKDLALFKTWAIDPGAYVLELACGTGGLSIGLARAGYLVTALEQSQPMLAVAHAKPGAENVRWGVGDMTAFALDSLMDVVLCHDDSLNHLLLESDLKKTFFTVYAALKPGGRFVFDVNTLENYRHFWQGQDTYEGPNYRLSTLSQFDELSGRAQVLYTAEEHTEAGLKETTETVIEQHYPDDTIRALLIEAGFTAIWPEAFNPVDDLPEGMTVKTLWFCQKPQ